MGDPIFDIFREEAREHLRALEKSFLDLESAPAIEVRRQLIDDLFRHAHSLKSDAKVVGLNELKQTAQTLEDILDDLRERPEAAGREAVTRGLTQFDKVRAAFESWQTGGLTEKDTTDVGVSVETADTQPSAPSSADTADTAGVSVETTEARKNLVDADDTSVSPPFSLGARVPSSEESFTVRVPSERLDRMLSLAGELRICQRSGDHIAARITQLRQQLTTVLTSSSSPVSSEPESIFSRRQFLESALDQLRRIASELRSKRIRDELLVKSLEADIRDARLLPLAMLTDSLRRAARDVSQSLGKAIHYQADVGKTLLDKAVIESLKDPLVHLIRNAADHGIESAEQRRAAGKSANGTIRITASQRGPAVRITVSDDGGGVNFARIREQIRQTTDLDEGTLENLSEQELTSYLFRPGFSTAQTGEISGRGVGLDVVQEVIQRLHGSVELQSSSLKGTTFVLTVPVSISMARILTVVSGSIPYGILSNAVIRTGRVKRDDLRQLEGSPVLLVDGQPIRWIFLAELLGEFLSQQSQSTELWSYLLVARGDEQIAVAVDELEDETEVLLKPLGFPLHSRPDIVGATLRSDGAVQLVLDLANPAWTDLPKQSKVSHLAPRPARRIMVVDDSPTTRAVLRNVFSAAGYFVSTATDGIDAIEQLRSRVVDLVVSDVEMPRLNGFDLTRQVKSKFGLPVILVTGREKEEHRREGLAAGADAYVVKSTFQDQGLLQIVQQFI
jgi:two-component system chemotaxis sensor kinase CheA